MLFRSIEMGENTIETLAREFGEECGYQVVESKLVEVLNGRVEYISSEEKLEELTFISIVYSVTVEEYEKSVQEMTILDTEDISDFRWFDISEAEALPLTPTAAFSVNHLIAQAYS